MVYGAVSRIAEKAIRHTGIRLIERYSKIFTRYDKKVFRGLYGESGGRGVRHGRDIGAAVGGLMASQGKDDLDGTQGSGQYSSRSKPKAYRGYGYKRGSGSSDYRAGYNRGRKSCAAKRRPGSFR